VHGELLGLATSSSANGANAATVPCREGHVRRDEAGEQRHRRRDKREDQQRWDGCHGCGALAALDGQQGEEIGGGGGGAPAVGGSRACGLARPWLLLADAAVLEPCSAVTRAQNLRLRLLRQSRIHSWNAHTALLFLFRSGAVCACSGCQDRRPSALLRRPPSLLAGRRSSPTLLATCAACDRHWGPSVIRRRLGRAPMSLELLRASIQLRNILCRTRLLEGTHLEGNTKPRRGIDTEVAVYITEGSWDYISASC